MATELKIFSIQRSWKQRGLEMGNERKRANHNSLWDLSSVSFLRLLGFISFFQTLVLKSFFLLKQAQIRL